MLDGLFVQMRDALAGMRGTDSASTSPSPHAIRRAVDVATELDAVMVQHLTVEERMVFPRLALDIDAAEWEATEQKIQKDAGLRVVAFTLPWVIEDANPLYLEHLQEDLPRLFSVVNALWWSRAYDRCSSLLREAES